MRNSQRHGQGHDERSSGLPSNFAAEKRDNDVVVSGFDGFASRRQECAVTREAQARRPVRHGHRSEEGGVSTERKTSGDSTWCVGYASLLSK